MGDPIPQHRFQTMHTESMTEIMQVRPAIAFVPMHYSAFKQDIPEVMIHRCFVIMPIATAAPEKEAIWLISCVSFTSIPFDVLHHRVAHRDIAILIVLRVYNVQDIFIHVHILHPQPECF